jgi:hypothetical protein
LGNGGTVVADRTQSAARPGAADALHDLDVSVGLDEEGRYRQTVASRWSGSAATDMPQARV